MGLGVHLGGRGIAFEKQQPPNLFENAWKASQVGIAAACAR